MIVHWAKGALEITAPEVQQFISFIDADGIWNPPPVAFPWLGVKPRGRGTGRRFEAFLHVIRAFPAKWQGNTLGGVLLLSRGAL